MNKISLSVYHLIHFCTIIDKTFRGLEELSSMDSFSDIAKAELKGNLFFTSYCQILILTNSIIEEYEKFFITKSSSSKEEKEKIEKVRQFLKPVFKKIMSGI